MNQIKSFKLVFLMVIGIMLPMPSIAAWVDSHEHGKVVYFLFAAPNKIVRYDTVSQSFLDDIVLDKAPTAFTVSQGKAFVGFYRELYQIDLALGTSQFVQNTSTDINAMVIVGDYLYAAREGSYATKVNMNDLSSSEIPHSQMKNQAVVASEQWSSYYYLGDRYIRKTKILSDGTFEYRTVYRTVGGEGELYINATESKIYDNSGKVYFASNISETGSLGARFDTLTFSGDNPVVLRGDTLYLYNSLGLELGKVVLNQTPNHLASHENTIFDFVVSSDSVIVSSNDISSFALPKLGLPMNPVGLFYQPELYEHDGSDIVYLIDNESLSVFRWSAAQNKYLETWPLRAPVTSATFSKNHNRLYLSYSNNDVTYLDASQTKPDEILFLQIDIDNDVHDIISSGNYLVVYGEYSLKSFDISATELSETWGYVESGLELVWNSFSDRIYSIYSNSLRWVGLNSETGLFVGNERYVSNSSNSLIIINPLLLNEEGNRLLNGAGQIIDASDFSLLGSLSNNIDDGAWVNNNLVTIRKGQPFLQFWGEDFHITEEFELPNAINAHVFKVDKQLLLIQELISGPSFGLYDLPIITDSDADGLHDLEDNCVSEANSSQADFDADGVGDVCDNDNDNDSLPDDLEISLGLNPQDRSDADGDLDSDGFSNRVEYLQNSALDDSSSVPSPLAEYSESFDGGWPAGFYGSDNNLEWRLRPDASGGYRFQSIHFSDVSMSSETNFTALFKNGILSFKILSVGNYTLQVLLDGKIVRTFSYYNNEIDIDITAGVHTITLKVVAGEYGLDRSGAESYFLIDDFTFSADSDGDSRLDRVDNCPNISNRWQDDYDGDGLGDACDNDPRNQDTDKDGYGDIKDNCPDISNPNQLDIDDDGLGDVCDDTDDRPADIDDDGLYGYLDNCPEIFNVEQLDIDEDGIGDACDDTDDRPADMDADGLYDYLDNCPNTVNPEQKDFDYDGVGDLCDDDSDGDGISNSVEREYDFLDELDSSDALLDFDSDGVNNLFEITSGLRPDAADDHVRLELSSYYPLDDIEYTYLGESSYQRVTMERTDQDGVYSIQDQNGYYTSYIEERVGGVYLIRAEPTLNNESAVEILYSNFLLFPAQMALGETLDIEYTVSSISAEDSATQKVNSTRSYQLIEVSEREWQGKVYPSITIRTIFESGFKSDRIYLKGIGQFGFLGMELDMIKYKNKEETVEKKESGGGSFSWFFLVFSLVLLHRQYQWKRRSIIS